MEHEFKESELYINDRHGRDHQDRRLLECKNCGLCISLSKNDPTDMLALSWLYPDLNKHVCEEILVENVMDS